MTQSFYRLAYMSTATQPFSSENLAELARTADSRNRELDVTGILLFDRVNFWQMLEGRQKDVITIMDSIKRDRRHAGILYLESGEQPQRLFSDWGMRLLRFDDLSTLLDAHSIAQLPAGMRALAENHSAP